MENTEEPKEIKIGRTTWEVILWFISKDNEKMALATRKIKDNMYEHCVIFKNYKNEWSKHI